MQLCLLQGVPAPSAAVHEQAAGHLPYYRLRYQYKIAGILTLPYPEGSDMAIDRGLTAEISSVTLGNLLKPKQPDVVDPPPAHNSFVIVLAENRAGHDIC